MARVAGIDLPKNKRIDVALEYIYGIGKKNAKEVLAKLNGQIDPATRVKDLTPQKPARARTADQNQQPHAPRPPQNGRLQSCS